MNIGPYIVEKKRGGQPMIWIMMGAPGSGKSTWIKANTPSYAKWLDVDAINKSFFDATSDKYLGTLTKASNKTYKLAHKTIESGESLILDGTGANPKRIKEFHEKAKAAGYKTYLAYIDVPAEVAITRAVKRYVEGGRYIPEKAIIKTWQKVHNSFKDVKNLKWDNIWRVKGKFDQKEFDYSVR